MTISMMKGMITGIRDLSPTAREITITPERPFRFIPGMFVNIFMKDGSATVRRAYSISSDSGEKEFTIAARLLPDGAMSPRFWQPDIVRTPIEVMGPLGVHTTDSMKAPTAHLFAFGIGAGVIKAVAERLLKRADLIRLVIVTGNRSHEDMPYGDEFTKLAVHDSRVTVRHVFSRPEVPYAFTGYVQNHISDFDVTDSDVYICGPTRACESVSEYFKSTSMLPATLQVEAFG